LIAQDIDSDDLDDDNFVPAKKSRKTINNDDDDDFVDDTVANSLRAIGEFMNCGKCEVQFTVVRPSSPYMLEREIVN
jgi:hypothetical protein